MRQRIYLTLVLLCVIVQGTWAWEGTGKSDSPYLIKTNDDWKELARQVSQGKTYSGEFFRMTADIDALGVTVGSESSAFSGTFDGDGHTLTFNKGTSTNEKVEAVDEYCAPFVLLAQATVRHLKVTGLVVSSHKYAAGIASRIGGTGATTISDCHVSIEFIASSALSPDATFGGIVGAINDECGTSPTISGCSFTGSFQGWANCCGGMVGWTRVPVNFEHCMVDLSHSYSSTGGATFIRTTENLICPMTECFYTSALGLPQGEGVFSKVSVPEGCTYRMVSEPTIDFDGMKYWTAGAIIYLSAPADVNFNHWESNHICYLSNPWLREGQHQISDISAMPSFSIRDAMPTAKMERTMDGTRYRYLGSADYQYYLSKAHCAQKGYYLDGDGWLVKTVDGKKVFVTAVTGWENGKIPSDGAQIHNDLAGVFHDHTLMGVIAPFAFNGCTELKTLYFKDTDANNYNALTPFDFVIGDYAFANCPNLTEVKMMQYTTEGTNRWTALKPSQVSLLGDSVLHNSPNARFSTDVNEYQNYLSSTVWAQVQNRVIVYNHTNVDFTTNGAKYSYMRNTAGEALKNDGSGHNTLMQTLRLWNADYQNFTASSLLATNDEQNIWYASIVGCDDDYLKKNDGTLRIYNDPGSYYNYKTIVVGRDAFKNSGELKNIEFWQTNGRSENSYSDLKMVIQNGALAGCKNLKELRLFYYCQDGDDHWETLGPENVIPGNNIFGVPAYSDLEGLTEEQKAEQIQAALPKDFKILVSPDRYQEFLKDPNWANYSDYIQPVEFNPNNSDMKDFSLEGLTYGYMTSENGMMQTSQTVSQDVSWWTAPRIAIEVLIDVATFGSSVHSTLANQAVVGNAKTITLSAESIAAINTGLLDEVGPKQLFERFATTTAMSYGKEMIGKCPAATSYFITNKFMLENGTWVTTTVLDMLKNAKESLQRLFAYYLCQYCDNLAPYVLSLAPDITAKALPSYIPSYVISSAIAGGVTTASLLSSKHWGSYNGDLLQKGMKANILSNMHQVGLVGGGYVITTPQKNLCYHTYIKNVGDDVTKAVIYAGTGKGQGRNNNARTMTMAKNAFRNHTKLEHVGFHETGVQSDEAMPMLLTIPDSAFVGCTNLKILDLRVSTDDNGMRPLGPECFIHGGDSIFAGLDPQQFHIVIDPSRKQDFLDSDSWKPLEQYFVYVAAEPKTQYQEYGGNYAYAYENGTTQKVNKVSGHKIEHTVVTGADNSFITEHQGALKLCNDIGVYNNYQLDAVTKKAFMGNQNLRVVNFTDLKGSGAYGDCYTGLQVALMDSCFADCKNLADIDMLYLVTDGDNHIDPIRPEQVTIGKGVLDGTKAKIKLMPQQVEWFEADTTWNKYKDRFMACIIRPSDEGIHKALKPMAYYDMAHTGYDPTTWDEFIDLARIAGIGFSWLDGKFREQADDIRSFADFRHFESVGLDYVGKEWFRGCRKLTNIVLPRTIKTIEDYAFTSCSALQEIELPAAVATIGNQAFDDCKDLKTIRVLADKPATLAGSNQFSKNEGLKIYVPAASVDAYKKAWAAYKDYIVSDDSYKVINEVTLTEAGTLADKLGLYVEWSYSGAYAYDEPRYIHGNYTKYDSLVVHGPLNDLDLWTIRYLTGNNGYDRGGVATDGNLRYLNLYDTRIVKDNNKAHYLNKSWGIKWEWLAVKNQNELPYNLFFNCTSLESIVLPKTLTKVNARIFEGCSALKRLAIPASLQNYDTWDYLKGLLDYPLEELVFVTDKPAVSDRSNPWGQKIKVAFTKKSQLSDYMSQPYLTNSAQTVIAPFEDDAVMTTLAGKGLFFPSEYLSAERLENVFTDNTTIKNFDEFKLFNVRTLDRTFAGATALESIALPDSLTSISAGAFSGCTNLRTIRITKEEVPALAAKSFGDLPSDFRILVPKNQCMLYREKWAEYADHINVDESHYAADEWTVVTTTAPNTLAEKLGFEVQWDYRRMTVFSDKHNYISGVRGDYSKIKKLKVVGPISGSDFAIMRYLAGFCPWANCRNVMGPLEAIDLYDAEIKKSDDLSAPDMFKVITHMGPNNVTEDNALPTYAFLQAYNLKSLVLPKSCTKINTRAMQQCEALETLVLGDDLVDFDWSALDDDVMLTRLYIMAKKKPAMTQDNWLVRQLYNNYNPTFDAFYVRPSLYEEYIKDRAYTKDLTRTNLISKGVFDDDDSFCAFARHAAATQDDLGNVTDVEGWFDRYTAARNLTPLKYTAVDSLKAATMAPLTKLECVALPKTLKSIQENTFAKAGGLRYADFLMCEAGLMPQLNNGGLEKLGIDKEFTLVYVPSSYGTTQETNVVVGNGAQMHAATYRMIDTLDYMVPIAFEADRVVATRLLAISEQPYTFCVPYKMNVPVNSMVYQLSERSGNKLVFTQVDGVLEAMKPYLITVRGFREAKLNSDIKQTIPANGGFTYGKQVDVTGYSLRGTFKTVGNAEAADLGAYILQNDGYWHPVSTANQKAVIKPFRAYLLPSARTAAARIGMSLIGSDDDTTGIDSFSTIDSDGTERTYDLQGREIDVRHAKGFVITNGKKTIKK